MAFSSDITSTFYYHTEIYTLSNTHLIHNIASVYYRNRRKAMCELILIILKFIKLSIDIHHQNEIIHTGRESALKQIHMRYN